MTAPEKEDDLPILAVYDGSSLGDRVLVRAAELAGPGGRVTVLVVVPPRLERAEVAQFQYPEEERDEPWAAVQLARAESVLRAAGMQARGCVSVGPPALVVRTIAEGHSAIVIGSRPSPSGSCTFGETVATGTSVTVVQVT